MQTGAVEDYEKFMYTDQAKFSTCIFCGSPFGSVSFKGKCVCKDCVSFVKELM